MKRLKKIAIESILIFFLFILFIPFLYAKGKESVNLLTGYCCYKENVVSSDQIQCKKKGGDFYSTKSEAFKKCISDTIFCCANGKVSETSPEKCKKYGGTPHKSKGEALKACKPEEVYCCLKDEVDKVPLEKCKKSGGKPYKSKSEAERQCQPEEIYCCVNGNVDQIPLESCRKYRGTVFSSKVEALKKCQPEEIYCCVDGNVRMAPAEECKKRGGDPYETRVEILRNCGWCCVDNRVFASTSNECRNRMGNHFTTKDLAKKQCQDEKKCCFNGKLVDYRKFKCESRKGRYFRTVGEAEKECRVDGSQQAGLKKRLKGKGDITRPSSESRLKGTILTGNGKGSSTPGGSHQGEGGQEKKISHSDLTSRRSALASSLPVEITLPFQNQVFQRNDTMQVRYMINTPTGDGMVTFRLFSSAGEELATTTHSYSPPDLSSVDLSEAELERADSGLLGSVGGDLGDRPLGTGERQFSWTLPAGLETPLGMTLYITAQKEGLRGRSGNFHIQPEFFHQIRVSSPNGGEHWEACSSESIRWHYFDDPATMPREWNVELIRGGSRQFLVRSRCTVYEDHSDSYPPYRECIERSPRPCLESGTYRVRVTGDGLTDQSDAGFRIGITDDWPMLALTSPSGGRTYAKGGYLPIGFYSTSPVNVEIKIIKGGVLVKDRFTRDGVTTFNDDYRIPEHIPVGDNYTVQILDRDNSGNSIESRHFSISETLVDFRIVDIGSHDGSNLFATIRTNSPESTTPFSGRVRFAIERVSPYASWTVIRDIGGEGLGGRVEVNLGDMNLPADTSRLHCGVEYRVTVDGSDEYEERDEENNSMTREIGFAADRGYVVLSQAESGVDSRLFHCGKEPDSFTGNRYGFYIQLKNCGINPARGSVEVRQVGSWPSERHAFPTSHDIAIERRSATIESNETEVIEVWNEGSRCWDSTLEFHFYGDYASWVSENPLMVDLHVSLISRP